MKKALIVIGIILVVLAAGGAVAVKILFPPEKVKSILITQAQQNLKREVKVGDISIGLFKGIAIQDFALSESPSFKNGTFIQSGQFVLKFRLLPLLAKKIMIDEIRLESPQITIIQKADGKTFNFSDLITASTASASAPAVPEKEETPAPISLTISKAVISKGKVEFIDQSPKKIKVNLNPIDLSITATGLDKPMSVDLTVGVNSEIRKKKIVGNLKTKSVLSLREQGVHIDSFYWHMDGLTAEAKGSVKNFSNPELELSASIHDVNLKALSQWISLPKEISISGSPQLGIDIKGSPDNLQAAVNLDCSKVVVSYADFFKKGEETNLSLALHANVKKQKDVVLDSFKIKLGEMETSLSGRIQNLTGSNPTLQIQITSNKFEIKSLAKLSPLAYSYNASGQIGFDADITGSLNPLKYHGSLQLQNIHAQYEKYIVDSVSGNISFTEDSCIVPQISGKMTAGKSGSDFKIQASAKNFKRPELKLNADFSVLDLGALMPEEKKVSSKQETEKQEEKTLSQKTPYKGPEIQAEGQVTIGKVIYTKFEGQNAKASWNLTGITPNMDRMNGTAEFEMKDGKINKIPLLSAVSPVLKIDPSGLAYSYLGGHWVITQGTGKTEDTRLNSSQLDAFVKGLLYLPTNKPDMILTAKLPARSMGGTAGELTSDEQGRPTFVFKLKDSWKPSLDTSEVRKKVTEKATKEIKKKGSELLEKEGKKLLEGLFK